MKVFYHHAEGGNVGDDLNAVLWSRLLPELDTLTCADWLIGVGTILDARVNTLTGRKIVMGSGFRPGAPRLRRREDVHIAAVRGRLSAEQLQLPSNAAVCDPGFLIERYWPDEHGGDSVALVPHIYSERWSGIADAALETGLRVISPTLPLDEFLRQLRACSRVFTESLHGAIFADALRIPWARVRLCSHYYESTRVQEFKWCDAFSTLDVFSGAGSMLTIVANQALLDPRSALAASRTSAGGT